jgi:hypothetical protein
LSIGVPQAPRSGASPPASPQRSRISRIVHVGTGWHPVGLAQSDHPVPRGQRPRPTVG